MKLYKKSGSRPNLSLNRYGRPDSAGQSCYMISSRVQSEKQGQWQFPILSNGVGCLNLGYGQQVGRQLLLTLHIHTKQFQSVVGGEQSLLIDAAKIETLDAIKGSDSNPLDKMTRLEILESIGKRVSIDRKAARVDAIKETLLSEMVTKTQTRGGCLEADNPTSLEVNVSKSDAGLSLPINQAIRRVGNSRLSAPRLSQSVV